MQGVCMGLFLMMSGLGNYVSEAILKIVRAATGTEPPMVFNATFINISVISWRSVLLVEETGVPGKKPPTCHKPLINFST
jgi:hypothetical protein